MNTLIKKTITSPATAIALMLVWAAALAFATIIEKYTSTEMAKRLIYFNPAFFIVQLLLVINYLFCIRKYRLKYCLSGGFLVHIALIIILAGAAITHFTGREGIMHLREGETSDQFTIQTSQGTKFIRLPFSVELRRFNLVRYPGSASPSSYESEVLIHADGKTFEKRIFMNNILDMKGFRFFQASYDKDEQGTILSVNRDNIGRNVTYTGYAMLAAGLILVFAGRNSRFSQLRRQLKDMQKRTLRTTSILLLILIPQLAAAAWQMDMAVQEHAVPIEHAARFGAIPIQAYNGRVMPINTFSSEVLRKVYKKSKLGTLNSDQFLLSLLAMPEMWMRTPLIDVRNRSIIEKYGLTSGHCTFMEMFDTNGRYLLEQDLDVVYGKMPAMRNRFDKDLMKLDEQVNILYRLFHGQLLNIFPAVGEGEHKWYAPGEDLSSVSHSDSARISDLFSSYIKAVQTGLVDGDMSKADEALDRIEAFCTDSAVEIDKKKMETELRYNRLNPFKLCRIFYLVLGGLLLITGFTSLVKERIWMKWSIRALSIGVLIVFHLHMMGMGMRWLIGGYAPWSNSYETMVYVAWASTFGGLVFYRRSVLTFAIGVLFGGVILFVSGLNWMDPQINLLAPVLKSPWLMFHVAVIVAAYGFFGIGCILGINNLALLAFGQRFGIAEVRVKELSIINEMALWIGLALMTIGTFLGAIWANESWGRYWGWDPKETWALITIIVYSIVLHLRLVKKMDDMRTFNLMSVLAIAAVLMTYFGVNYFLSGMHSYGS
ncbi:MAG: cytochrome c biogenesis protein CcsA [Tannerellaceae bacterium]|jgi:cytochrome c-type biogenesis protein CcsB|nr:cytochrome c biogenesis protein CcsA [Tannerellaceae bacterium]